MYPFIKLALAASALALTTTAHASELGERERGEFELCEVRETNGDVILAEKYDITMRISGFGVTGYGGCNWYSAEFSRDAKRPLFDGIGGTERACEDDRRQDFEDRYFKMLRHARTLTLNGQSLVVKSHKGNRWVFAVDCADLGR